MLFLNLEVKHTASKQSLQGLKILPTQALPSAAQGSYIPTKPLLALEPKMRIELTTYALRVRCSTPELPGRVFR